ncbi:MAG: hypothetical protein V9F04_16155 [Dermatophilaceae bacterium]
MPAITVPDLAVLPTIEALPVPTTPRPVVSLTTAPRGFEGEGFPVKRAFAGRQSRPARSVHHDGRDGRS